MVTESRLAAARCWGKRGMVHGCRRYGVSFQDDKNVLKLDSGNIVTTLNILKKHGIIQFKMVNFIICGFHLNRAVTKR